ncbi:MAG: HEAT repeat domain-containing protein [Acidobacteria bacterium]|nr:HEAT repeat domain-containing protein [Acidobacteriota bacterium]
MSRITPRDALIFLLSAVFTAGLTFATVELPRVADSFLQETVQTPGFDSHADRVSHLKTELFIAHFHVRALGYGCFAAMVLLVVAGFATRRAGLAAAGGLAFILPLFAQFAGVMFFLAGLGLLNVVWLPVLDLSLELSRLGLVIRVPYDLLRRLLGTLGVNGYWPVVLILVSSGLLIFFLGTFAWLSARVRGLPIAERSVYRFSRHPQYLGWIVWSYGLYLLLERGMYPRRSWGISASLPWLLSTMVILAVAMLEELQMRRHHPEAYERYRRSAPFLLPFPAWIGRLIALPCRVLFGRDRPERRREVAAVVSLYTALLMTASILLYGGGAGAIAAHVLPSRWLSARAQSLAVEIRREQDPRRRWSLADRLARSGATGVRPMLSLLADESPELRVLAARRAGRMHSESTLRALQTALADPVADVRYWALRSLSEVCSQECIGPVETLLHDPEVHIRVTAMTLLADLGSPAMGGTATELLSSPHAWQRAAAADALGALGAPPAVTMLATRLDDPEPAVRRSAVLALLRVGTGEAAAALQPATRDDDWEVRLYAAEALRRIPVPQRASAPR